MLNNIMLGRYIPGDSLMHRLDPRSKLLGSILFFVIVFQARTWLDYMVLFTFMILSMIWTKIQVSFFIKSIQPMFWIILFTAVFQIFFITSGTVLVDFGIFKITWHGVKSAFFVICRFVLVIGMSTLLSLTTDPLKLADALESFLKPFKRFGVPTHEIAMILAIAMRFVPTILDETQTIMNAQKSRGVEFNEGNMIKRINAIIPILIPLFAGALRRAEDLAQAMESRGYQGGDSRTKYRQLHWRLEDSLVFVVLGIVYLMIIII